MEKYSDNIHLWLVLACVALHTSEHRACSPSDLRPQPPSVSPHLDARTHRPLLFGIPSTMKQLNLLLDQNGILYVIVRYGKPRKLHL